MWPNRAANPETHNQKPLYFRGMLVAQYFLPTSQGVSMRPRICVGTILFLLLLLDYSNSVGQQQTRTLTAPNLLTNNDVLRMVEQGVEPNLIITKILTSRCNFDVFPPVLRDLKRRGVPDKVLLVMQVVPNGPPGLADVDSKPPVAPPRVTIPAGTTIELETARATSSGNAVAGDSITFLAKRRVYVNDVLVIERGAVAKARVIKSQRARAWGRAGMLAWELMYVTGVDGTQIPIQLGGQENGKNRSAAIAGGALATGALVFPYTSPIGLIWGLKKGDEAVLRGSRVFSAIVPSSTAIAGFQPRPGGAILHDMETVKASTAPPRPTNFERSGVKPKGFRPNGRNK
jgi:hypothetical protein